MFSFKGRIVTAVALSVSLVAMAAGQQPAPRKTAPVRPVTAGPVTPAPATATVTITSPTSAPAQLTTTPGLSVPTPATPQVQVSPVAPAKIQPVTPHPSTPHPASVTIAPHVQSRPQPVTTTVTPQAAATTPVQSTTRPAGAPRPSTVRPSAPVAVSVDAPHAANHAVSVHTTTPAIAAEVWQQAPHAPSTQTQPTAAQTPAASAKSPDFVEEKGFKGKVFEIKHRDADSLANVLRPLGSGFKGATISTNNQFKTVTVRDFPENIAAIEEAIKRLDTPETPSPDIEFTVHILVASNGDGPATDLPPDLAAVVKQLQSTLRYKNYILMTSAIHRGKEGAPAGNSGIAESKLLGISTPGGNPTFYQYQLNRVVIDSLTTGPRVQVGDFRFSMRAPLVIGGPNQIQYENIGFNTPVSVREGEKAVVGTTSMGDKGLIVVLSVKVAK